MKIVSLQLFCILDPQPTFISGGSFIYEEKTASRYTDVFLNCSVDPTYAHKSWDFENTYIVNNDKYSQNISGLIIHNVTEEDQGQYVCFLGELNATVLLNVICKSLKFN